MLKRATPLLLGLFLAIPVAASAGSTLLDGLLPDEPLEVQVRALRTIQARGDRSAIPALIDLLRLRMPIPVDLSVQVLERLSGQRYGPDPRRWAEWLQTQWDVRPPPEYLQWKGRLFSLIDPAFQAWFQPEIPHRVRIEEILWSGRMKDAVPALTHPTYLKAAQAGYLAEKDVVFGVTLNGDSRAYPQRLLDWHELVNTAIGGVPVALTRCAPCGSAVLYQASVGEIAYTFGPSGLRFRSNLLMYDHQTQSLWQQMTGEPVVGRLAQSGLRLKVLPVVMAPWGEWRDAHPDTLVLDNKTGHAGDSALGGPYTQAPANADTMFPIHPRTDRLQAMESVFAVRIGAARKAYPLETFRWEPVVNDRVGYTNIVAVGRAESRTARAYERGGRTFRPGRTPGELSDAEGGRWRVEEERLTNPATGERFPRVGGYVAYWFAWFEFFPGAEVYTRGR